MRFISETDQKLNLNLAADLAKEFTPFLQDSIAYGDIMHTMHYMMVMNPRVEIYMLDGNGKILAFFAEPGKTVKKDHVDLIPIKKFLHSAQDMPIEGDDPRNIGRKKTFSATTIKIGKNIDGYLYVVLGGEQYDSASAMIKESYIIRTTAISLTVILVLTGVVGLILFAFLTKRFRAMTATVKQFEQGNFAPRLTVKSEDEIGQLAKAFNSMADTIVANMEELKRTDDLRRELVANVSHDLRSPLASVQGYLETILMKDENLNSGELNQVLSLLFGHSFHPTPLYFTSEVGVNNRTNGYSDEFRYEAELGYTLVRAFTLYVKINSVEPFRNGDDTVMGGMGGLYANNQRYLSYGPGVFYDFYKGLGINVRAAFAAHGENVLAKPAYFFGVFLKQ